MRFRHLGDINGSVGTARETEHAPGLSKLTVPAVNGSRIGHCPDCGFLLTRGELLIEYDDVTDKQRLYAECRFCDTTLCFR